MTALVRLFAVGVVALTLSGSANAARVPDGVSSITIRSATGITTKLTLPGDVAPIVKAFDALPRYVARPCPVELYRRPDVSFDFRAADGSVLLHAVDHGPGTCGGSISYTTVGHVKHATLADDNFVARAASMIALDIDRLDPIARTAANERLARRDAAHLLRLAVLPSGSRAMPPAPGKGLDAWDSSAYAGRTWKVQMPVHALRAFERAHLPGGSKLTFEGTERYRAHPGHRHPRLIVTKHLTFSFPAFRHRVPMRQLTASITSLGNGWTQIGFNASDAFVTARAPDEVLPRDIRTIEIRKNSRLVHRVAAPETVATIVRWFNALSLARLCNGPFVPAHMHAPTERIAFRDGSGQVLARASAYDPRSLDGTGGCLPIDFSASGHSFAPLVRGHFLIRVEKLLR